jgi:hypothetical protein
MIFHKKQQTKNKKSRRQASSDGDGSPGEDGRDSEMAVEVDVLG